MKKFHNPPTPVGIDGKHPVIQQWKSWFLAVQTRLGTDQVAFPLTLSGSPFYYQNPTDNEQDVIMEGGTISLCQFSQDKSTFYTVSSSGMVRLSPGDWIAITYSSLPTVTIITR